MIFTQSSHTERILGYFSRFLLKYLNDEKFSIATVFSWENFMHLTH